MDYMQIGNKITYNGEELYSPDMYDDGCTFGYIFKDEKAFVEDKTAICYIPEHAFDDVTPVITIDGNNYYRLDDVGGYTRDNLDALLHDDKGNLLTDEEGDEVSVEYFFSTLLWAYPETYFHEMFNA